MIAAFVPSPAVLVRDDGEAIVTFRLTFSVVSPDIPTAPLAAVTTHLYLRLWYSAFPVVVSVSLLAVGAEEFVHTPLPGTIYCH